MSFFANPAEAGPHEAPEHVEIALKQAFRKYHRARKLRRITIATITTGAVAAGLTVFVQAPVPVDGPAPIAVHVAPPQMAWTKSRPPAPVHKPARRPRTDQLAMTEFVPLPFGDDSLVSESATIIRVELPRSALRLAGFNVAQERANDRVEADVVLGPDGLAHAVRFVGY